MLEHICSHASIEYVRKDR